ncbi:tRNA-dihydrouridine(47) synthase [NAD(P)(+)]-like [Ostrinia furnacalis]|uniref:tRNA-dihydrouridine(47) synthase [NAD(P)(+)]-like n=1 Tax=Ostrinia furnacalis TaxID=93504 RepID=UPI0010398DDB|nr:tRNA-dihydrouridine(47) synthase [NAD(P)(+)]-like [Ostrinia furnacalis]
MSTTGAGICVIKEEFVVKRPDKNTVILESGPLKHKLDDDIESDATDPKKPKGDEEQCFKSKNKSRGQNKARPKTYRDDKESKPCPTIVSAKSADELIQCQFNNCKFMHSPLDYLKVKPKDITNKCHLYDLRGRCPRGISCRFGSSHITPEGFNKVDEEKFALWKDDTKNTLQQTLQIQLQKKKYDLSFAEKLVKMMDTRNKPKHQEDGNNANTTEHDNANENGKASGAITDEDIIKLLPREKKLIDWRDKLYLSPLTTVGNLPFRRICKTFGVDITCGEMALCESLLKGTKQEWALVKRHETEDLFGAQICGNNVYQITKVSQLLQENTELDFIDLNVGCPIDLIYKKGGGSGMMHRLPTLEASIRCASKILSVPFTVKIRTGVYQSKKIAHTLVPKIYEAGASLITLHGRSREARYTKSADWEYIETCAQAAKPCPVFGNGDILTYDDYIQRRELAPTVQGVMIGRGALIKPWIFTEIKEQRLWDISSHERFEILKKYTNYGLEHWGSDTQGVENTRRFLLEWLSFLYRYVPVGLLERPPQKINERPPVYFGRDDMETLMASGNCADWIKISEMLLGPTPEGFQFLPKHKANSYE